MTGLLTLRIAWKALLRNKLRTFLTMLGIIIGVGAVIAMLSIGNGAQIAVQKHIAQMGTNIMFIFPGAKRRHGASGGHGSGEQLTLEDWRAVSQLPMVAFSTPVVRGSAQVVYGPNNWLTSYRGVSQDFPAVRNWPIAKGRMFSQSEVRSGADVVVLGEVTAQKLFGSADPVGETVRVADLAFKVVGVLSVKGGHNWGTSRDDTMIVPYTTAMMKLLGSPDKIQYMMVSARRQDEVIPLEAQAIALLNQRHGITDPQESFQAFNQAEVSKVAGETTGIFAMLLGGIASVSLLVGGIGIMNIMLVSVTERIREIGIRMAVGARGRDILLQFLVEAIVLSAIGGAIGVLMGTGISVVIAHYGGWPVVVSQASIVVSFGFAALIGIFFGFYPALQASRLDPIEALRHE